ncbi:MULTISPECIES: siderophore-interacting protein [Micromonospora]|uniref:NADPH-dependent ferric siderophore reductase, contains FAD-binding and SIP domains n=1 Tax=Micromonospora yangpuensis TaxID=683228 RepID=A0A1C6V465_9ACTN|nr:siderophore-interacting protein [Micromonospora yangpuensis]GGM15596.1 siderophore-interacting protein [Micromonospora yangpuensis]SCL61086.1 NADPH-dependent ferric siderophore reductase, contains FAD-binding and SIP domains [Micromonospora yangpuensis]
MTERPKKVTTAQVVRTERPTPHLVRLVLGGAELVGLPVGEFTDHYVKLVFPVPGVTYPEPMELAAIKRDLPRAHWPRLRAYTVRAFDPVAAELTIDVVHHGDEGLAGPWAAALRPGDPVYFVGPGGAYAPSPTADWHLLVGDESALPAIGAALARLPRGAAARVFVEVADAAEEQELTSPGAVELTWLHRAGRPVGEALVDAVRALEFPPGTVHAFVHGEATFVKELRRLLRVERGVPREQLSISGYWRRGMDDEGWRSTKPDWNRQVEAEEAAVG